MTLVHYPPAPWHLQGQSYQALTWMDVETASLFIPSELEIVRFFANYTLGGVYLAEYTASSVLNYHELIVVPGFVKFAGKIGAWISHIYVDHPISVAGGREIWGLPKELAKFVWHSNQISVYQADQLLCQLQTGWQMPLGKHRLSGQSFSHLETKILNFVSDFEANLNLIYAQLTVAAGSPFSGLDLENSWLAMRCKSLKLEVHEPEKIGDRINLNSAPLAT